MSAFAKLAPYDGPRKFQDVTEATGAEFLINTHMPDNRWDKERQQFDGVYGASNAPGEVHLAAVIGSENRLRRFRDCERMGKVCTDAAPRVIQHPHTGVWYTICLPDHLDRWLTQLSYAGERGIVFSGTTPEITLNDGRKWTAVLRQLGIVISTTPVPLDNQGNKGNWGHRFTLHSRVAGIPPAGEARGSLYLACQSILDEFRTIKKAHAEAAGIRSSSNIDKLCDRFPNLKGEVFLEEEGNPA